jgi:hypothetical protein
MIDLIFALNHICQPLLYMEDRNSISSPTWLSLGSLGMLSSQAFFLTTIPAPGGKTLFSSFGKFMIETISCFSFN